MSVIKTAKLYFNQHDLSTSFKAMKPSFSVDEVDNTMFGTSGEKSSEPGLRKDALSVEGIFSGQPGDAEETLSGIFASSTNPLIIASQTSLSIGGACYMGKANEVKYEIGTEVGKLFMNTAEFGFTEGFDRGVVLMNGATAYTNTNTAASSDNGAASTFGAVAVLLVPVKADTTAQWTVSIQDSADNSSFATILSFSAVTNRTASAGAQRVALALDATVRRYVRATATRNSGTTSITPLVGFFRRLA